MYKDRIVKQVALWLPFQHSTTISGPDIAKEMQITQPLIHYHFGSMKKLMKEAFNYLEKSDTCGYERARLRESLCCKSLIYGEEA